MMHVVPKSHEDRIADLERQVAELKRIVGAPGGALGGLGGIAVAVGGLAQSNAQAQQAAQVAAAAYQQASLQTQVFAQAQNQNIGQAHNLNQCLANQQEGQWFSGYENIIGSTQGMTVKQAATAASNAALRKVVAQCLHDMTNSKKGAEPTFIYGVPTLDVANEVIMTMRQFDYENRG